MATETKDLVFKIKIEGTEREVKSLKDLKQAKKDATDAFLRGDKDAAKALAELKDKTEDLADATRSLKTDGVEPLTGSFGLFKEGLGTGDFDKISLGFKGLGAAMSALPLFLLVEGVKLLIDNFDDLVAFFGKTKSKSDQLTDALNEQKKANEILSSSITNQIKLLEAQGGNETKILALKKELIAIKLKEAESDILIQKQKIQEIITNDSLTESLQKQAAALYRVQGNNTAADLIDKKIAQDKKQRIKEVSDKIREDVAAIQNLRTEDKINEIKDQKDREAAYKKHLDNIKAIRLQNEKEISDNKINGAQIDKDNRKLVLDDLAADEKEKLRLAQDRSDVEYQLLLKKIQDQKEAAEKEKAIHLATEQAKQNITALSLQASQNLSDTVFAIKLSKVQKGSAAETEILKKQFEINKKIQIAQAAISGATGIVNILSAKSVIPQPFDAIYKGVQIVALAAATAASIAKISSAHFDSGASVGASGINANSSIPNINTTPPPTQTQPTTTFTGNNNNNFQQPTVKAVVVETDITNSQNRVNKLTRQAQFG